MYLQAIGNVRVSDRDKMNVLAKSCKGQSSLLVGECNFVLKC